MMVWTGHFPLTMTFPEHVQKGMTSKSLKIYKASVISIYMLYNLLNCLNNSNILHFSSLQYLPKELGELLGHQQVEYCLIR